MSTEERPGLIRNKEAIIKIIIALLAKADPASGATKAEAEESWSKAQEMISKHRIDGASLHAAAQASSGKAPAFDIGEDFVMTGRVMRYDFEQNIGRMITRCFGVKVIWTTETSTGRKRHAYYLIGDELDRAIAKAVYPILIAAMLGGVRKLLKEMTQERGYKVKWTANIGRSYYDGLEVGYVKLSEQGRKLAESRAKKEDVDAFAIVLVDKSNAIEAYKEKRWPNIRTLKDHRRSEYNHNAFYRGTEDGKALDLDQSNKLK